VARLEMGNTQRALRSGSGTRAAPFSEHLVGSWEFCSKDRDGTRTEPLHLGYFLKSSIIADELQQKGIVGLATNSTRRAQSPSLQTIQFAYHVDDDRTDHNGLDSL